MKTVPDSEKKPLNHGIVISVRGSIVDVWFEKNLPPIYALLYTGEDKKIAIEVLAQLDNNQVRGIALSLLYRLANAFWGECSMFLGTQLTTNRPYQD
jgi:F-type H+-transporting ATPase subunit beta